MKTVVLALSLVVLAACMPYRTVTSPDPNWMRLGGYEPQGYPRTFVETWEGKCYAVTEAWFKSAINGRTLWTKRQSHETVTCP
jgi:hypothetical protein